MTDTRIERRTPQGLTLQMVVELTGYSPAEIALIARTVANDATLQELAMFLHSCRQLRLDPLLRQAYLIKRKDTRTGQARASLQVGIDGYRGLADRQGNYAGSSEPTFRRTKELKLKDRTIVVPDYCQVVTWKIVQGQKATFVGEARWDEFYPGPDQGFMWHKMPFHQLAKCAEAQSLRKGWPALLGAIEMSPDVDGQELPRQDAPEPRQERPRRTMSVSEYNRTFYGVDEPEDAPAQPQEAPVEEVAQARVDDDAVAQAEAEREQRSEQWQTNRRLGEEAAKLKLKVPTLRANSTLQQLTAANAELQRQINQVLDEQLARDSEQEGWSK